MKANDEHNSLDPVNKSFMRCRLGGLKELLPSSSPVRGGQRPVAVSNSPLS